MLQTTLKKSSANYLFNDIISVILAAMFAKIKLALFQGYSGANRTNLHDYVSHCDQILIFGINRHLGIV